MIKLLRLPKQGLMRLANLYASGGLEGPENSAVVAACQESSILTTYRTVLILPTTFFFIAPKSCAYADGLAWGCTCWDWSTWNRVGTCSAVACVWPSWHERVVPTARTGVAIHLTGQICDHSDPLSWRDINDWPLRSVATDGTIIFLESADWRESVKVELSV